MAKKGGTQALSERIDALKGEIKEEFGRLKVVYDQTFKEMKALSLQYERLAGKPLASIFASDEPAEQVVIKKRRGRQGGKSAKLAEIGQKIYSALKKQAGTKFTTARIQSVIGDGEPVGPAYKQYNKSAAKDSQIKAAGPGRAREYWVD